jgi:hypothetical protein
MAVVCSYDLIGVSRVNSPCGYDTPQHKHGYICIHITVIVFFCMYDMLVVEYKYRIASYQ